MLLLLFTVVVKLVKAAVGKKSSHSDTEWVKYLTSGLHPHLQKSCGEQNNFFFAFSRRNAKKSNKTPRDRSTSIKIAKLMKNAKWRKKNYDIIKKQYFPELLLFFWINRVYLVFWCLLEDKQCWVSGIYCLVLRKKTNGLYGPSKRCTIKKSCKIFKLLRSFRCPEFCIRFYRTSEQTGALTFGSLSLEKSGFK